MSVELRSLGHAPLLDFDPSSQSDSQRSDSSSSRSGPVNAAHSELEEKPFIIRHFYPLSIGVIVLLLILQLAVSASHRSSNSSPAVASSAAIAACLRKHSPAYIPSPINASPRTPVPTGSSYLIRHATIWDGLGGELSDRDVLISSAVIQAVSDAPGARLQTPPNTIVIDATGRLLSPGLMDLHSHAGVYPFPAMNANQDGNEESSPLTPQMRAIHAFDPDDFALAEIRKGGVLTSLILPGSANNMGGEGFLIKLKSSPLIKEFLIPGAPRQMKMACGENPKREYGSNGVIPRSRMGEGWLFRKQFSETLQLMERQRNWCANQETTPFPKDPALDSLVSLMTGSTRLHVHCYTIGDLQTFIDISQEFNITVSAFHHALEAYRIPELIKSRDITIATFADLGWYKKEAYNASVRGPAVLHSSGAKVALKSDHPVTLAGELIQQASRSAHYGLDRRAAFAAVTSVPAAAAGLSSRTGAIRVGMDADILIWNTDDALEMGARPDVIFIDGIMVEDYKLQTLKDSGRRLSNTRSDQWLTRPQIQPTPSNDPALCSPGGPARSFDCYAVRNVDIWSDPDQSQPLKGYTIVVTGGIVSCLGPNCAVAPSCQIFDLESGIAVPGFIHSGSTLGLIEIEQEDSLNDGSSGSDGSGGANSNISPVDGVRFDTVHVKSALWSGVTSAVIRPTASWQFVTGSTDAYLTCCGAYLKPENVLSRDLGLNVRIGDSAKSGDLKSISSQIAKLRATLKAAKTGGTDPFDRVISRAIPLIVEVDQIDAIISVLQVRSEFNIKLILLSAAEVHLAIPEIQKALADISVVFYSSLIPDSPSRSRFNFDTPALLQQAGISFAISTAGPDDHRNLRWFAGRMISSGLTTQQALRAITSSPARIFDLSSTGAGKIEQGKKANFVLFNDHPLDYAGQVQLVAVGSQLHCRPQQP